MYFKNLDFEKIADNKLFSKAAKSFTKDKINLIGMRENNKTELKTANVLKEFFSNIVKSLEIGHC